MIAEQKINEALKIIGKKAELDEEIIIECTRGGIRKYEPFKKHNLLTNHTARRSLHQCL